MLDVICLLASASSDFSWRRNEPANGLIRGADTTALAALLNSLLLKVYHLLLTGMRLKLTPIDGLQVICFDLKSFQPILTVPCLW